MELYYFPQGEYTPGHPDELPSLCLEHQPIAASVTGNVELELMAAGLLPSLYVGANIHLLRQYERYE